MGKKRPSDATPDIHAYRSPPESVANLLNRYGTYNIQPTADTDNLFPLIAPGLPRAFRSMKLGRKELDAQSEREG